VASSRSFLRQRPIELGVVELEAGDPEARRRVVRLLLDGGLNLPDGPKVRIDAVQLLDAARMAVRIDEAGRDRHLLRVDDLRPRGCEVADVARRAHRDEPSALHREGLGPRLRPIGGVDDAVDHDQVGFGAARRRRLRGSRLPCPREGVEREGAGKRSAEAEKFSACIFGRSVPPPEYGSADPPGASIA
jgi:hypothetical protein